MPNSRILVTGAPRSGTTWVGRLLCARPGARYLHEPFNVVSPPAGCAFRAGHWYERLEMPNDAARLAQLDAALSGQVALPAFRLSDLQHPRWLFGRMYRTMELEGVEPVTRIVLKDPLASLSADVLSRELALPCVVLVRDPAAVVSSFLVREWDFDPRHFRRQPAIWDQLLAPEERAGFASVEREPGRPGIIGRVAWMWRAVNRVLQDFERECGRWVAVEHERFIHDALPNAERMFARLDLPFGNAERDFIAATQNRNASEDSRDGRRVMEIRASVENLQGLAEKRLTADEIARIGGICAETYESWKPRLLDGGSGEVRNLAG